LIFPVVAPDGTVTLILVLASEVIVADLPLTVTCVAPDRCVPVIVTTVPTGPDEGLNFVIAGAGWMAASVRVWSTEPGAGT